MLKLFLNWFTPSRFILLIIVLLTGSVFGSLSLLDLGMEEPRRALVALEMMLSKNYIVPTLNGEAYYNKPPLFNWFIVLCFKIFGSYNDWIVRLPSTLGFFGMAGILFLSLRKYVNKQFAIFTCLIFLTAGDVYFHATLHAGEIDLFYSFLVVCQAVLIFHGYQQGKYVLLFVGSYVLMAAGVLTKGIPSIAFQGITLVAMAVYYKDFKLLFRWQHFAGLGTALLLLGAYFIQYNKYNDALPFIIRLFTESSEKSVVEKTQFIDILKSVFKFPLFLVSKMLPWSILIIIPFFFKNGFKKAGSNSFIKFMVLFTVTNMVIYWLTPGVKIRYLYMFFPFFIALVSYFACPFLEKIIRNKVIVGFILGIHIIVSVIICIVPFLSVTSGLQNIKIYNFLLLLIAFFNMVYFIKKKEQWLLSFILLLVIARLEMNATYIRLKNQREVDNNYFISQATKITEGENIYLTGEIKKYPLEISLGPLTYKPKEKGEFTMPPYIYYKIPYYISLNKMEVMKYDETPETDRFYMASKDYVEMLDKSKSVLLESEGGKYVLFTINE